MTYRPSNAQLRVQHSLPLCTFRAAFARMPRALPRGTSRWHAGCTLLVMPETKAGEIEAAELDVARTKQRFQQSLELAGETSSRLAAEMRKKATPAMIVAVVVVGGAALAGAAFVVTRGERRSRWGSSNRPTTTGILARAAGVWLLRTAALRLSEALVAKFDNSRPARVRLDVEPKPA